MSTPCPFCLQRTLAVLFALLCLTLIPMPCFAQFETRATELASGSNAEFGAAVGDFNHDGKLDIAVTGSGLFVLLGNGDGTFKPPTTYSGLFYWIATADFNNDGNLDIVVATGSSSVSVFLGNGDGTFRPPKSSSTTSTCSYIAVGDFNGDHKMDIAVVDGSYISLLLGRGDGTFEVPIDNSSFVGAHELAVGDFNNDNRADVVVVGFLGTSQDFGVMLGNGDGTLQEASIYPLADSPGSVSAADFNRDGKLDVAIGAHFDDGITIMLGNGDGSFQPSQTYEGGGGRPVVVGDFNQDGKLDIIASPSTGGAAEFLGNGDGTFEPVRIYGAPNVGPVASGDTNGDHRPDLLLLGGNPNAVVTMLNTGAVNFSPSDPLNFPTQLVGSVSAPLTATLNNSGTMPLIFSSVSYSGKPFHAKTTCKGSVAPGGSCTVTVTFSPQSKGTISGTVTLHDSASSKTQVMELIGTGTVVQFAPTQLTFLPQKEGTQSPAQSMRLTNTGSTPLDFTHAIEIGGPDNFNFFESDNCPTSLASGASCTIHVVFAPRQKGQITQSIVANDDGGGSPQSALLSGTGN
jgi:hypothetical protein